MPIQPFRFLLDKTVDIERNTPTQDAVGGQVDSWAAIASNVRAAKWGKKKNEKTHDFGKDDGYAEEEWAFEEDPGARRGDRIKHGSNYYEIVGFGHDFTNGGLAIGPYIIKSMQRTA